MNKTYCSKCGAEIENEAKFCTNCGNPVATNPSAVETTEGIKSDAAEPANSSQNTGSSNYSMNHSEIKAKAKTISSNNKWNLWKPMLVYILISSVASGIASLVELPFLATIAALATIPLSFGCQKYTLSLIRKQSYEMNQVFSLYSTAFWLSIEVGFLMGLFIGLWSLLLIIPGIIAAISYTMVPFLVADDYSGGALDCLKKSKDMMNGYKWDNFCFELSFIGWYLLGAITFGIAFIWFMPYITAARALYYDNLKNIKNV